MMLCKEQNKRRRSDSSVPLPRAGPAKTKQREWLFLSFARVLNQKCSTTMANAFPKRCRCLVEPFLHHSHARSSQRQSVNKNIFLGFVATHCKNENWCRGFNQSTRPPPQASRAWRPRRSWRMSWRRSHRDRHRGQRNRLAAAGLPALAAS